MHYRSTRSYLAAVAFITLGSAALAQSEPPIPGPRQSKTQNEPKTYASAQSRAPNERGTKDAPLVVEIAPSEDTKAQAAQDAKEREAKATSDWWLIVLTGALAIATVGLVVVTGGLVWFAWKQADDMKKSIAAAEGAAQAASDQVELSRQALISNDRAFVTPTFKWEWRKNRSTDEMLEWIFWIEWHNVGNTPTKRAHQWFGKQIRIGVPRANAETIIDDGVDIIPEPITIMHGKHVESVAMGVEIALWGAIKAGDAELLLFGFVDYDDVFDGTSRHRTEVCVRVQLGGNPAYSDCKFRFERVTRFNGIDEECSRQKSASEHTSRT